MQHEFLGALCPGFLKHDQMRLIRCGMSKTSRIVWVPESAARQPCVSPEISADSTGYPFSSEVTSTTGRRLKL